MTGAEEPLRAIIAAVLAGAGLLFTLGGAFGIVRFSDVFARIHAVRATSLGAPLILAGIGVEAWDAGVALRLALLGGALALIGPALAHLLAYLAHRAGVEPAVRR
jgi:monovalent cation/proton antiporter MnhG/PhaG subunit